MGLYRLLKGVFVAAVLLFLVFGAQILFFAVRPAHPEGEEVKSLIEIRRGEPARAVAQTLFKEGMISDPTKFMRLGSLLSKWSKMKVGEYSVSNKMSPLEIFNVLESGVSVAFPLVVPEGRNMYEIAALVEATYDQPKEEFLEIVKRTKTDLGLPQGATLEGFLFPDTYFFPHSISTGEIVDRMIARFKANWTSKDDERAKELGLNRYQVVTLASIVEKETGAPEERPLISSVFHNRLKKKMRLQSDPTTIYGIWNRYKGNIHRQDLLDPTPYNTYAVSGLPKGPISNPGRASIEAALYPSTSDFLYFVSKNDGTHVFSRTFEEHNQAVKKFQLDAKAREGKSWRNRLKTSS